MHGVLHGNVYYFDNCYEIRAKVVKNLPENLFLIAFVFFLFTNEAKVIRFASVVYRRFYDTCLEVYAENLFLEKSLNHRLIFTNPSSRTEQSSGNESSEATRDPSVNRSS